MANTKIKNTVLDSSVISGQSTVTAASNDLVLIQDVSDSDNLKKALVSDFGTSFAGIDDQSSSNDDQLTITDSAVIINEDSDDVDFRVESNGNANMLFVDGGNDKVGVGKVPATNFSVSTDSGTANDDAGGGFELTSSSTDGSRRANMYLDADNGAFGTGDSGAYFYIEKKGGGGEVSFINQDNAALNFRQSGNLKFTMSGNNLHLNGGTDARIQLGTSGAGATSTDNDTVHIRGDGDNMKLMAANGGSYLFEVNGSEVMRITSDGRVGIGTGDGTDEAHLIVRSPTEVAIGGSHNKFGNLHVSTDTQGTNNGGTISMGGLGRTSGPTEYFRYGQISGRAEGGNGAPEGYMCFETTSGVTNLSTEHMRIASDGAVTITGGGHANGGAIINLTPGDASDGDNEEYGIISAKNNGGTTLARIKFQSEGSSNNQSHIEFLTNDGSSLQHRMRIRSNGTVSVSGAFSKGSGSFEIPHPLDNKKDTHKLRHSFIEGPQCDNIYRGKVTLSSGTATVDLDSVSGMTSGTFVALNRDIQVFTTNESDWNPVKGSVSGNVLTITCQDNTSTDTVSWMVIGERQDDNIKESQITDDNGYLVVEPENYENDT